MTQGQQVRDSVVYMVPALVGNVLPLVTLPLITRALSPAEYGMWALALAYGSFVIGLASERATVGSAHLDAGCVDAHHFDPGFIHQPADGFGCEPRSIVLLRCAVVSVKPSVEEGNIPRPQPVTRALL